MCHACVQLSTLGRPINVQRAQAADEQLYKTRVLLGSIAADVGRLRSVARVSYLDEGYAAYACELEEEAERYIACASQLRSACLPYVLQYNDILLECMDMMGGTGDVAKRHVRSKAHAALGHVQAPRRLQDDGVEWRYAPRAFWQQAAEAIGRTPGHLDDDADDGRAAPEGGLEAARALDTQVMLQMLNSPVRPK